MILLDERVGSRECLDGLRRLGADAEIAGRLDADFQFTGNGEHGDILIGIEKKTISEFLTSIRTRRLAGAQVGPMQLTYDIRYLVIEGIWRRGRDNGIVEVLNGKWEAARGAFRYAEVQGFIASIEEFAGLRVWRTADEHETAAAVVDRYTWWQKEWDEHKLARTIYAPVAARPKQGTRASLFHSKPTLLECWLAQLPRIDARAYELAKYFESAGMLAQASIKDWIRIPGIGRKTADQIVDAIWKKKA